MGIGKKNKSQSHKLKGWALVIYDISQGHAESKKITHKINRFVALVKAMNGFVLGKILPESWSKNFDDWFGPLIAGTIRGSLTIMISQMGGYLVEFEKLNFIRMALRG